MIKIDNATELLIATISSRASSDVLLLYISEIVAHHRGQNIEEVKREIIKNQNDRVVELVDEMQKYI
jgi:hypothetical protein